MFSLTPLLLAVAVGTPQDGPPATDGAASAVTLRLDRPAPRTELIVWTGRYNKDEKVYETVATTPEVVTETDEDGGVRNFGSAFSSNVAVVETDVPEAVRRAALALPYHNPARAETLRAHLRAVEDRGPGVRQAEPAHFDLAVLNVRERAAEEGGGVEFQVSATVRIAPGPGRRTGGYTQSSRGKYETWVVRGDAVVLESDELAFTWATFPPE